MERFEFLVVGGGIAGVSVGYELARDGRVCLLEREEQLSFHATGRSAAIFMETYGNAAVRALTSASRAFYAAPPDGFAEEPLTSPRGALFFADEAHLAALRAHFDAVRGIVPSVEWVPGDDLTRHVPCLAPGRWVGGLLEPGAVDLDVHAIHQGFVRGLRARGGVVRTEAEALRVTRAGGAWTVATAAGELSAPFLVNAAGAWADVVAGLAGAPPIGLRPLRRTAILVDAPGDVTRWPMAASVDEELYFKPESGRLLVSPCDETPSDPCNAAPEDYDVAVTVDRLERATLLRVNHVHRRWAGLRSFVADRTPVIGPDPACEGLVWLAAQGGYGIQIAPALARACRALCVGDALPADLLALGLAAGDLGPRRPALRRA
ncbi:NAD(P)/FAD-dependent oxidoreductase [Anaeromyxobacter terrae]|uniref:NAD(P)/FAD-dependent oxidoreductase n=1 Tax=Anaeromyxobacter terrae TaxID=2925406 RepID=UPI001F57A835|nr:FAD-binding oxidoreductase [Anaeromyxobacter sp. SG22]